MIDLVKLGKKGIIIRASLLVGAIALVTFFFPRDDSFSYEYSLGRPWSYSLLTAPFDMPINLDSLSAAREKDSVDAHFIPIYQRNLSTERNNLSSLSSKLAKDPNITPRMRYLILDRVRQLYTDGIVDNSTYEKILTGNLPDIRFVVKNVAEISSTDNLHSVRHAYAVLDSVFPQPEYQEALINNKITNYLIPNVTFDEVESNRMLEQLYQKALAPIGVLQKGERIIDRGDKITPQTFELLQTYEKMMAEKSTQGQENTYRSVGQILITALLFCGMFAFMIFFRPRTFLDTRKMVFLVAFMSLSTIVTFVVVRNFNNAVYLIPFATVPLIVSTFYDSRTAFFANMVVVLLCALISPFPLEFILLQVIAGLTAILSIQELSKRSQLIQCAFYIFIAYCLTYVGITIFKEGSIVHVSKHVLMYFALNGIILSFAYVLIFLIEKLFGFVSPVTLVELSDVNNPLLRELSEKCPGTFQHSLQVANLASEAAHQIGANVQLVRAGALYHDIGKIDNPAFFTENQRGVNPHSALSPEQSAHIVINHVKDGIRRAERAKLPDVIQAFISEHHGVGKAKYFYLEAVKKAENPENVDAALFTYPGPNPSTKETSILMMADATEAASKSLADHSDASIAALVQRIIGTQIDEGLFNNSPISFRDIEKIKKIFIERLCTFYHARVSYPDEIAIKK